MTIRRALVPALMLALQAGISARALQSPTQGQGDDETRLLAAFETALASGDLDAVRALEAPDLPPDQAAIAAHVLQPQAPTVVVLRERLRKPIAGGSQIVADAFVAHDRSGRLATWRVTMRRPEPTGPLRIAGLDEQGALEDLLRLSLDATHEYAVQNLDITAPDLTLTMTTGTAFTATSAQGVTALVLHGHGQLRFSPAPAAEQGQLKLFAGQPDLRADVQDVFLRVNPGEFVSRVSPQSLVPVPSSEDDAARARSIFDRFATQTYAVDLRTLGQTGWSIEPSPGSLVVEFGSSRHGWLTYARAPEDPEDVTLSSRTSNRLICSYASAERIAAHGRFYSDHDRETYDVEHEDLDVTIDPETQLVRGHDTLLLRATADRVGSLTLHLDEGLSISSVSSPGFDRLLPVRIAGQPRVLVMLPGAVKQGSEFVLDVDYAGHVRPPDFDREALNEQAQTAQGLPEPTEEFRPDPEPVWIYSGRAAWYPEGETTGHATATMHLTVPAQYGLAASGTLVRSTLAPDDAGRLMRSNDYVADRPVRYLACVIARLVPGSGARATVPDLAPAPGPPDGPPDPPGAATVDVNVVSTPREVGPAKTLAARAAAIIQFYARTIGEAPYPADTIVAIDDNLPGGHSPAYLTILRQRLPTSVYAWRDDPVAFDRYPDFLLAHEVAHQWWGQAVGWKSYHDQWLSEGLAQYFAALDLGASVGPAAMRDVLAAMCASASQYATKGPIALGDRLGRVDNDPRAFRVTIYNKSAVVLHMLRRLIGDPAFFAGLDRFYRTYRFADAGTDDFRAAMQAGTPLDLSAFFDQWIEGSGRPRLRVTSRIAPDGADVVIRVDQIGEVFELPLTVTIDYKDGRTQAVTIPVTSAVVEQRVPIEGPVRRLTTRDPLTLADYTG